MAFSPLTTKVPPGNPAAILNDHNILKLIVIIDDAELAQTADDLAQSPPVAIRKVIWFPDGLPPNYISDFGINPNTAIAFSLKPDNTVADIITEADVPVDDVRMALAYSKAEV